MHFLEIVKVFLPLNIIQNHVLDVKIKALELILLIIILT